MKKLFTLGPKHHGRGSVVFAWHPQGNFLATCGQNRLVNIFNRQGEEFAQIPLDGTGKCMQLIWDQDGEMLAVLQQGSPLITLWDANQNSNTSVDTGMKDLTFIKWSIAGPHLAICTAKGNLLIYNKRTLKKQSIVGKHVRKITSGHWTPENKLVLTSEDRQITISNADGDTINQTSIKCDGSDVQLAAKNTARDASASVVVGQTSIMLCDVDEPMNGHEIRFLQHYGAIVAYRWFGDGYLAVAFDSGYLVVMATNAMEGTQEVFANRDRKSVV